jgi:arginyl-tRNA synthetase
MALWRYRLNVEQAEWIIYVTDVGQQQHFDMVFSVSTEWHQGIFHLICFY